MINLCHRSSFFLLTTLFLLVCLFSPQTSAAQTALTAGVRGRVTAKHNGAGISGARVTIKNKMFGVERETTTDAEGRFLLAGLAPANNYEVHVQADGFREYVLTNTALSSGEFITIDAAVEVSAFTETVEVTDAASLVVNNAPEVSQVVDTRRVSELPSNGRSLNRFALLDPHVRQTAGLGGDGSSAARLTINANSFRHTYYKLDGNSNYDFVFANAPQQQVSISAVQEFKVLTNMYSAEHGGSTAGFLLTTTKGGTDSFHGEGFFFLRPSGIQAAPPASALRVPNQLTQFGGAIGGPVWNKRTNFFLNYEHSRQNRGSFIKSPQKLSYTGHFRDHLALARFDHRLNDLHTISLRLNANRNENDNPNDRVSNFVQPSAAQQSVSQSAGAQFTDRTVWGKAVNELRLSYVNSLPSLTSALSPQVSIVRPSYSTEGGSSYSWVRSESIQLSDQIALQKGKHSIRLGGDLIRQKVRDFSFAPFGEYRFAPGAPKPNQTPIQYTQTFGVGFARYGQTLLSAFMQDDWRALPRLTLNLGLRYDNQSSTDDRNNFAPRLGFAYDVAGNGKTIVRGGAGIFYDQYYLYITRRFFLQGFTSPTATFTFTPKDASFPVFPNYLNAPPQGAASERRDLYLPADKLLNPYSSQFSIGVQRTLFNNWVATFDLIHARTLKQMRVRDMNAPAPFVRTLPGQRRTAAQADATRPYRTLNGIAVRNVAVIENTGKSNYDSLDLGLLKRFSNRFQLESHYVYSSALTSAMFFGEPNTGVPSDWGNSDRTERGPSDYHQRHRFVTHGMIEMPLRTQLSLIATLGSGLPVNPLTGVDNNGDTNLLDRPVGLGRNSFRTPAQASFDASLAKRFALKENAYLELRAEAFNLFNHGNYIRVDNIYGDGATPSPSFLKPQAGLTNADPARQIQFGLRFVF